MAGKFEDDNEKQPSVKSTTANTTQIKSNSKLKDKILLLIRQPKQSDALKQTGSPSKTDKSEAHFKAKEILRRGSLGHIKVKLENSYNNDRRTSNSSPTSIPTPPPSPGMHKINNKYVSNKDAYEKEVSVLAKLSRAYSTKNGRPDTQQHPLIIRYYGHSDTPTSADSSQQPMAIERAIKLENMENGSLEDLIAQRHTSKEIFTTRQATFYLVEITEALLFLHENGILHADLKPSNVQLKTSGHVCLSDFGHAISGMTHIGKQVPLISRERKIKDMHHIAPEHRRNLQMDAIESQMSNITFAADWFSLGYLGYRMYHRVSPYGSANDIHELTVAMSRPLVMTKVRGPQADLIQALLSVDPTMRPKGESVIRHWGILYYNPDLRHINGNCATPAQAVTRIRTWIRLEKLTPPIEKIFLPKKH